MLLKQTSVTSGDFLNTQDSLANATRILGARVSNLAATFGDGLVPAAENAVSIMGKFVTVTENYLKLQEKLDKFAGGPLSSEAIENFKLAQEGFKGISEATSEFLGLIKEVDEAQAHSIAQATLRAAALDLVIEKLKESTGANEFTDFIDGIGRSFEEDVLPPMEEVISGLGIAETATDKWLKLQETLNLKVGEAPKFVEEIKDEANLAADAAGRFSQNLARALISGQGLEKVLLSAAISFGLSLIPGGSLFGKFAHGGIAPGGFVPSIVGEGGGAPEIIQSASPIKVTPINNRTVNNNGSVNLVFPNVTSFDKFTVENELMPLIREQLSEGDIL